MARNTATTSLPCPTGGWNALDSLADMPPTDARFLVNWFPSTTDILLRFGYSNHATGLGAQVETLAHYSGGATDKLFAWAGTSVFDATASGAVGAAVVTALTNARWQFINVANAAGNWFMAVNGVDKLLLYDGTTWEKVDGGSAHAITGVTTSTLVNIYGFKHRVWFIQKNTLDLWYLGTDAISGAATKFSLAGVCKKGGYLVGINSWTIDAGEGVDDYLVFMTSQGELIAYKGTDPASATTWALHGVWELGAPIGYRCFTKYSGDLLIICQDGVQPLSGALQSSRVNPRVSLTNKIQYATSAAISSYSANFGWQLLNFPKENMLFLNVPISVGSQQQFVMNNITRAWCNFTGWAANCWELFQDNPYFGGNGVVCQAWNTNADNGTNINAVGAQAYSYFGARGTQKRWTLSRPIIQANGLPSIQSGLDIDFDEEQVTPIAVQAFAPDSAWDTSLWDAGIWGGSLSVYKYWQGINGIGFAASYRIQGASNGVETRWLGTDFVFEKGGVL